MLKAILLSRDKLACLSSAYSVHKKLPRALVSSTIDLTASVSLVIIVRACNVEPVVIAY